MPNRYGHIEVHTYSDGAASVAGERIDISGFPDPYTATMAHVAAEAERRHEKVLAHGIDHSAGQDSWFYVSPSGGIELAEQSDSDHVPTASSPETAEASPREPAAPSSSQSSDPEPPPPPEPPTVGIPGTHASEPAAQPGGQPKEASDDEQLHSRRSAGAHADNAAGENRESLETSTTATAAPRTRREARNQASGPLKTDTTAFVRRQKSRPAHGARGALYKLSGGAVNLGPSGREQHQNRMVDRISRQLTGSHNTAVLSLKGGIGKTSTTAALGLTLADYRGDPPIAIDANPDSGDLAERALGENFYQSASPKTISDVIDDIDSIDSLTELGKYVQHAGRFHLIAGEQDPALSDSLTAEEYLAIGRLVSRYYAVVLTDCGTGVTHQAMSGILHTADNLIIAAGYAVSGAKRAQSTLQWLADHGYEKLAREAVVVITDKDDVSKRVDKDAIRRYLQGQCRELIAVPHDRGVADGDLVSLEGLKPATRNAYRRLAAAIVDGYST